MVPEERLMHRQVVTPAMEAGLSTQVCTFGDLAMLIEAAQEKPGKRGPYKKQLPA